MSKESKVIKPFAFFNENAMRSDEPDLSVEQTPGARIYAGGSLGTLVRHAMYKTIGEAIKHPTGTWISQAPYYDGSPIAFCKLTPDVIKALSPLQMEKMCKLLNVEESELSPSTNVWVQIAEHPDSDIMDYMDTDRPIRNFSMAYYESDLIKLKKLL
jgi:hypothetical protein